MHALPFPSFLELENAREDGASFAELKNVCPQRVIRVEADVFMPSFLLLMLISFFMKFGFISFLHS